MKPDFRGYGRAETLLEKHIPRYDPPLAQKTLLEAKALLLQIQRFVINTEPKSFTIKDLHGEPGYWFISFSLPVVQYVPECFRFLTTNVLYHFEKNQWLEHVPSYIPNINHVTMFTTYNNGNQEFDNNTKGLFKKYIHEKSTPMEMFSFNIMLRQYSTPYYFEEPLHEYVKKSFEFCYWRSSGTPDDCSCINNLIYSTTSKIRDIFILRKTLVKILGIETKKEERSFLNKSVSGRFAKVLTLSDDGRKINCKEEKIFLLEHIAESSKEGDIINAVLVNIGKRRKATVLIGKIGEKVVPDNMECVLALVLSKMMQTLEDNSSPTKVATKEKILFEVTNLLQSNHTMFDPFLSWSEDLPNRISQSVEKLFPLFLEDGDAVYHLSPVMVSFLAVNAPEMLENKDTLEMIAKIFDTMKVNSNFWGPDAILKLNAKFKYDANQGSFSSLSQLFDAAPRLVNRMVYSRILSQHFSYWS